VKPELSPEQAAQFANARTALQSQLSLCGPTDKSAFSVSGAWAGSAGPDTPLAYSNIVTNVNNSYINFFNYIGVFNVPCTGQYFFTVSFVKDSYYICGGNVGTTDDVVVYLAKFVGATGFTTIDPPFGAWSGEGAGRRGTGAFSVVLTLNAGDTIASFVHSDGGFHRCLASYHFTGFRVAP
jgi:hypothetical protein